MAKPLPLTRRLNLALAQTNKESDKKIVYGLLYRAGAKCLNKDKENFYKEIDETTLNPLDNGVPNSDEIQKGSELAKILNASIVLPIPGGIEPNYRGKMIEKMLFEYQKLKDFYSE